MTEDIKNILDQYDDCIYIEVYHIHSGDPLYYHIGGEYGIIVPDRHSGLFQDSILYLAHSEDYEKIIDFRYWPRGRSMTTYSWSENIRTAVIKNMRDVDISFNDVLIPTGQTKVFSTDSHKQMLLYS